MATGSHHKLSAAAVALLLSALWWSLHAADAGVLSRHLSSIPDQNLLYPSPTDGYRRFLRHSQYEGHPYTHGAIHHDLSASKPLDRPNLHQLWHVRQPLQEEDSPLRGHRPTPLQVDDFNSPRNDRHLDSHIDDHPGISQMPKSKSSHILGFPNDRWCVMTRRCD